MFRFALFTGIFCVACALCVSAQAPIPLVNPSFEDDRPPKPGATPNGWINCGDSNESPPDIQPGAFSAIQTPSKGTTCLGLVVRDNNTSEGIAQRLDRPLENGKCYEWSLDACRSKQYLSLSKKTNLEANYTIPAKVRLWGGNGACDRQELLFETPVIEHHNWKKYTTKFQPKRGTYSYITIEIDFDDTSKTPYNGNVLLDNLTAFRPVPCPETATAAAVPAAKPASEYSKKTRIRYDVILFDINSNDLKPTYDNVLQEVAGYLERHPDAWVELAGHTSNNADASFAQNLSVRRAQAVADYLIQTGIPASRVRVEGFGKTQPLLPNYIPESRVKNQRVEIMVWQ